MPLEPLLLSYAGLASVALTSDRLRRDVKLATLPAVDAARLAAILLFALAIWRAVHHFGPYQGPVAFIGMLCIAGLLLILLLSRWPRAALLAAAPVSAIALGSLLLGGGF